MKIKFCGPTVFTNDASKILEQFAALGFEVTHKKENMTKTSALSHVFILEDRNGNNISIIQGDRFTQTFSGIRMKVDDFKEALEHFEKLGYVNLQKEGVADTGTSLVTLLRSPEGVMVSLSQHNK